MVDPRRQGAPNWGLQGGGRAANRGAPASPGSAGELGSVAGYLICALARFKPALVLCKPSRASQQRVAAAGLSRFRMAAQLRHSTVPGATRPPDASTTRAIKHADKARHPRWAPADHGHVRTWASYASGCRGPGQKPCCPPGMRGLATTRCRTLAARDRPPAQDGSGSRPRGSWVRGFLEGAPRREKLTATRTRHHTVSAWQEHARRRTLGSIYEPARDLQCLCLPWSSNSATSAGTPTRNGA